MKKIAVLFFIVCLIASLYGCGGVSDDFFVISHQDVAVSKNISVDSNGRLLNAIEFSRTKINTIEDNTLAENVVVKVTETMTSTLGINPIGKPDYIYVYDVSALLRDSYGYTTRVKSLEKPLRMTFSTEHLGRKGICYVGIRENKNSPWKYERLSENGTTPVNPTSLKDSVFKTLSPEYIFDLYKMDVQVALFAYNKPVKDARDDISVAGMVATAATPLLHIDNEEKYLDDFAMEIKLTGDNLSNLSNSDIALSIIYRTHKNTPATIRSGGFKCNQTTRVDDCVTGKNSFVHTLKIASFDTTWGGESAIRFALDLKGISKSDFPTDFLLELSSADNVENLIPFNCISTVAFKTEKQKSPDPDPDPVQPLFAINYDLDGGSLIEGDTNPDKYSTASETFTLKNPVKAGYSFAGWTGTGLSAATMEVIIEKGSIGDRKYKATWIENPPDTYTLTIVKGTGIASVSEGGVYEAGKEISLEYVLKTGYEFDSWGSGDVTVTDNKFTMPAKNVTVTANGGVITYNITYEGLEGATFDGGVANPESYDITSATITLNNPTKTGCDFLGWTGTGIEEGTASMAVTIPQGSTGPRNYVASWTESISTITLDPQGGDLSAFDWVVDNKITYTSASGTFNLPIPEKTNYYFAGWIYGENAPVREIEISTAENRTYVASWTLAVLTFTLPGDITLEMRYCPAGSFVRGGTNGDGNTVKISKDFYMGTYEVTNEQFEAIMGSSPSSGAGSQFAGPKQPVVYIKWDVIMAEPSGFIAEINSQLASQLPSGYKFALPTEAQWEYACRAGTTTDFNNGETMTESSGNDSAMNEVGWYYFNRGETTYATHEVGGKASNSFGLHDMHGNVFEWCTDWYAESYDSTNLTDPTGPETGSSRVLRGGSFNFYPTHCTSWYRFSFTPDRSSDNFGFRLALVPVPMPE